MLTYIIADLNYDYGGVSYVPYHLDERQVRDECLKYDVEFDPFDPWEMASEIHAVMLDDAVVDIMPTVEWEKGEKEKRRTELESTASHLAQKHGIQVNSVEFLELLDQMIDQSRSYREGMREDGLCIGFGVTPDQWQEEFNASAGDESRIEDLKDWMVENLPLLCAQYSERREECYE